MAKKQAEQVIPAPDEGITAGEASGNILDLLDEFDPGDGTLATDIREDDEGEESPPSDDEDRDESEELEEEEESQEEVEDDEWEEEEDEEDEVEDLEASDDTYTVKVDGEEIEVSLDELRNGYQRQAAFTRKTQEVAKQREQVEALQTNLNDTRQRYLQELSVAEQLVVQLAGEPPEDSLAESNPQEYTRRKARYDRALAQAQKVREQSNKVIQEAAEEAQRRLEQRQKDESAKLLEAVPRWKDPEVAQKETAELVSFVAQQYGLTAEELSNVVDSRFYLILLDAKTGVEASEGAKTVSKRAKKGGKRKPLKPGTRQQKPKRSQNKKRAQQLRKKLGDTGSVHDAAELFFGMDL